MKTAILIFALICIGGVMSRTASGCPAGQYAEDGSSGKICQKCDSGSGTTSNGCLECDGKVCTKCAAGFLVPEKGLSCNKMDVTCADKFCTISGTEACGKCAAGYRFAQKDAASTPVGFCVACTQTNCNVCTFTECSTCKAGFFVDNKACTACKANCAACTSATDCTTCAAGFFKNGADCTACGTGCAVCESATKCTTCSRFNILNATTFACAAKDGCEEGDGTDKCKTCADGFRLQADGTCKACDSGAQTCDGTTTQNILTCTPGQILAAKSGTDTADKCQARTDGICLAQTTDGKCTKCAGTNIVVALGKCVACSTKTNCKTCTVNDADGVLTCTACNDQNFLSGTGSTAACTACGGTGCLTCTDANTCTACQPGYFLKGTDKFCTACDAGGAATCDAVGNATACKETFGEQSHGICFNCNPSYNCLTCSEYNKCSSCNAGQDIDLTAGAATLNQCVACDPNCNTKNKCSKGPGTCTDTTCTSPYVLNTTTNKCENACKVGNCKNCNPSDYGKCQTCTSGAACVPSVPTGTNAGANDVARGGCNTGYFVTSAGACSPCATNCAICTDSTAGKCLQCMNGKRFIAADNANNCATDCNQKAKGNIDYCVEASGAETDVFCLAGFASTGTAPNRDCATVCTAASACVTCLKDKAAECDTCAKGKYKDAAAANVCKDCPANVAACTAADVHTECATGYLLGQSAGSKATCYKVGPNCSTAANTAVSADNMCKACQDGYLHDGTANTCSANKCQQNCTTCADASKCSKCSGTYQLKSDGTCTLPVASSVDGCTVHTANKYELCDTCGEPGWYKDTTTNTCKKCAVGGCTCTTSGTTECTGCINNKHKYDSSVTPNVCKACTVDKCVKCTADAAKCEECDTGYFTETDGSKCTACPENCATCAADKTKCDAGKCKAGFYVYTFSVTGATTAKYCAACPSNCKTCTIAATGKATCDVCITGNYLSATKTCTNADCSGTDGKACIKCTYGKILKDGKCQACDSDFTCPASCTPPPVINTNTTNSTTNGTKNGSGSAKIAFSFLVLAFFAILGNMMI